METFWQTTLWGQFGAAIDMLGNAVDACPDRLWSDPSRPTDFWYTAYHTLFFLDLYLSGKLEGFAPPAPFTMEELDPAGVRPAQPHSKEQLQAYIAHCREKCRAAIAGLSAEDEEKPCGIPWLSLSLVELHLYNMRHVQHHTAQLNLILREAGASAPDWVSRARE